MEQKINLQLLDRGTFIIKDEDAKDYKGRFCAWSFEKFCEEKNIPDYLSLLAKAPNMRIGEYADLIVCAIKYYYKEQESLCPVNRDKAFDWLDDWGGPGGETFLNLMKHGLSTIAKLQPVSNSEPISEEEAKKNSSN